MPSSAIGPLILFLAILLTGAHLLGYLFAKLRQPRVIGEILAGMVLGPFVLGKWPLYVHVLQLDVAAAPKKAALDLIYYMGLLMLMFISGAETKALFQKHERKQIAWLASVGTVLILGIPVRSLVPCQSTKKKVLFFCTGPPTGNPYWLRRNSGFDPEAAK